MKQKLVTNEVSNNNTAGNEILWNISEQPKWTFEVLYKFFLKNASTILVYKVDDPPEKNKI